jgi:integrase
MEDLTRIDDNSVVFKREGTYQARIRVDGKYVYRSLKTGDLAAAIKAAEKLVYKFEFNAQHGIPNSAKTFGDVINEYLKYRETEHLQGRTSDGLLRQIKRVVRFWQAYAGDKLITAIGDKELRDYVQWRRDYYTKRPNEAKKRNVKVNPTDKTLQFDLMIAKAVIKWAHEQGWRGLLPLPIFTYTPKKKRVRPAFENGDYRVVLNAIQDWIEDCQNSKHLHTRQLLLDYVVVLARS